MQKVPKCLESCAATLVCLDQKCKNPNPFICSISETNNECHKIHEKCLMKKWQVFRQQLITNSSYEFPQFSKFTMAVQELILKSIKSLQNELINFKAWKAKFFMNSNAIKLFDSIEKNQEIKWSGSELCKIYASSLLIKDIQQFDVNKFNNESQILLSKLNQFTKSIRNLYDPNLSQSFESVNKFTFKNQLTENTIKMQRIKLKKKKIKIFKRCYEEIRIKEGITQEPLIKMFISNLYRGIFQVYFSVQ